MSPTGGPTLVLITGTGRSGTSTMSGSLHHLGLYVPGPYLGANESNPKGFFESKWAVQFHKQITAAARINDFDSRPSAFARTQQAITPALREELRDFLVREAEGQRQIVVKDPRSVWAQELWHDVASELGLEIAYISMLRHPAEVVGSRTTYYANPDDAAKRRSYEIFNVARWINSSLVNEVQTRGRRRAFVSYPALLEGWRPVLARLGTELGLTYDVDVTTDQPSAVDEFIDPGLRRHQVTWDELDVPVELREIAEEIWTQLEVLETSGGVDAGASAAIDGLSERYDRLFTQAADIAHDAIEEAKETGRAQAVKEKPKPAPKPAKPAAPRSRAQTPVGEVAASQLLREVAGRAKRRLSR